MNFLPKIKELDFALHAVLAFAFVTPLIALVMK